MQFFSLRITALVFPFLPPTPPTPHRRGESTEEAVLMEQRQLSGGGGRGSAGGWTALALSQGSAWYLAKLTEPILSACHCNINTHLEQMWLKARNIEQTAATDPVPLHEHLCSINVVVFLRLGGWPLFPYILWQMGQAAVLCSSCRHHLWHHLCSRFICTEEW